MSADHLLAGRQRKFLDWAADRVEGDGCFAGYASLFGTVDLGRDVVMPGAFAASLRQRGPSGVRMLFQHDPAAPIGAWSVIREDAKGLYVEGRLAARTPRGREIFELMRLGAVDGLSIGFETVTARTDPTTGVRRILKADLWEISVVTFPMLPEARVTTLKAGGGRNRRKANELARTIRRATRAIEARTPIFNSPQSLR